MDHLIITATFSNLVVTRPLGASEISLQPPYLTAGLVSSSTIRGTTSASTSDSYSVTLDHPYLSGFGENQEIVLYLDGHPLQEHATVDHRSPDVKSAGAPGPAPCSGDLLCPDGKVTNADLGWFFTHYPTGANPGAPYSKLADYRNPIGAPIGLADFSEFTVHFAGSGHKYEAPGDLMQTVGSEEIASTHVVLGFTEEYVTALDHRLYVDVTLEDCADKRWCLFAIKSNRSDLTLSSWEPTSWAASSAPFSPVDTENGQELYFGVIMINDTDEATRHLGRLSFNVSGSDPVTIGSDQFVLTVGEIEPAGDSNGESFVAGDVLPVYQHMSGVSGRILNLTVQQVFHNSLAQNYPNPFNPRTTLAYSLHDAANVSLTIYDVAGRRVRELVNEHRLPGAYKVVWDGRDEKGTQVSSGVYFYKLVAGSFTDTKKMIMLK